MPPLFRAALLVPFALALAACGGDAADVPFAEAGPEALAALAVGAVPQEDSLRPPPAFFLADGAGATLYAPLAGPQRDPAMGFAARGERLLDGWRWWVMADSSALGPDDQGAGVARPDYAARTYARRDTSGWLTALINRLRGDAAARLAERVTMLDGRGAMMVEVPDDVGDFAFRPVAGDRPEATGYDVRVQGPTLLFARGDSTMRRRGTVPRQWLAVRALGAGGSGRAVAEVTEEAPEAGRTRAFGIGRVEFRTPGRVVVAAGATPMAAARAAEAALRDADRLVAARAERMTALLAEAPFETGVEEFDHALQWARLSLDALTVRDTAGAYVLPGVAGAEPPDGRSTLQTLDALLLTGRWTLARGLLTTFGRAQRFDERIDILGRAPNVVVPAAAGERGDDARFVTTDATPLYIAAAGDYVRATGDRALVSGEANFWFKTVFAFRGLINPARRLGPQLSPEGFLIAREGQAWTRTGVEPDPADRPGLPVEAQGRLYRALRTMTEFATIMGVVGREGGRWYADTAAVLRRGFERRYVQGDALVDRYDPRGQPDATPRPNALLALRGFELEPAREARLTRALAERLAYPWGVATQPQTDSTFHPYAHAPQAYGDAEAAFGGTVWTWLAGPLASQMVETGATEPAWELVGRQAALMAGAGVVGMIPDWLDAHPRGESDAPIAGGALVQPWSVAELVRVAWADFAGVRYAAPGELVVEPHLPEAWDGVTTRVRLGAGHVGLRLEGDGGALRAVLTPEGALPEGAVARVRAFGREVRVPLTVARGDTAWAAAGEVTVDVTADGGEIDGEDAPPAPGYAVPDASLWEGFAWVDPVIPDVYPVLRAAEAGRVLTEEELLRDNILAVPVLTQPDPDGDDWGSTSTYTYPRGFPEHVLDATYLEVAEDDSTTYFRAEFAALAADSVLGYVPTMVAVTISTGEGGQTRVGRDALYDFPEGAGYEYVVYLGAGLVLEDGRGRVLAEVDRPVFNEERGALVFALPRRVLPQLPRGSRVTMLVGARTEGGGVGDFRVVEREASRNNGGGKVDPNAPNVYDQVSGSVTR